MFPPTPDGGDGEFSSVVIYPHINVPFISAKIKNSVRNRLSQAGIGKVVSIHLDRLAFRQPPLAVILVVSDEFFLLRVYGNDGIARGEIILRVLADVLELRVPIRVIRSFLAFLVPLRAVVVRF